jgi:hypothetical protein
MLKDKKYIIYCYDFDARGEVKGQYDEKSE